MMTQGADSQIIPVSRSDPSYGLTFKVPFICTEREYLW
jgi:hypothetical protein